jgi:hypothetical protein
MKGLTITPIGQYAHLGSQKEEEHNGTANWSVRIQAVQACGDIGFTYLGIGRLWGLEW